MSNPGVFFYVDNLSLIMIGLVSFVGVCIATFSFRYLKGDSKQMRFYCNLVALVLVIFVLVSADHILLIFLAWATSNLLLTRLMLHKKQWEAARQSYLLALRSFILGLCFLGSALMILYIDTGYTSIQKIISHTSGSIWFFCAAALLLLGAMTQSALWPFHRWLTSSLNCPTPVSAIMHGGLVNGGGFILARFAPILLEQPIIINIVFIVGIISAILGTLWKLMKSDVKSMLACSTMGQMGFMIAQCGLGLFPAAVAHLCWHGLFKAYLFLSSSSAAQEKRLDLDYPPSLHHFILSFFYGAIGAYMFSFSSGKNIFVSDTTVFLIVLAMIAGAQFSLPIIRSQSIAKIPLVLIAVVFMGSIYGFSVKLIQQVLSPLHIWVPQPLNSIHIIALILLFAAWLSIIFGRNAKHSYPHWILKIYVHMLNASQPHPKTVTAHRNHYQF